MNALKRPLGGALGIAWLIAATGLAGQTPANPAFEVASIKPNKSGQEGGTLYIRAGTFRAVNVSLRSLIATAYGSDRSLFNDQIIGAPDWAVSDRFDIIAKIEGASQTLRELPPLLRPLLEQRFKLASHRETRPLPIFNLVTARADGRLGPQMQRSIVDCLARSAAVRAGATVVPPPANRPACGMRFGTGTVSAGGLTLSNLVRMLSSTVERLVVDRTGLAGDFDVELQWAPDGTAPDDRPSIFTAVEEQLGLKLESTRAPVEVLVIDRVEHPTED